MIGTSWEYLKYLTYNNKYFFNGKQIGVISYNFTNFYDTIKIIYPGGKISQSSRYKINDYTFYGIVHPDQTRGIILDFVFETDSAYYNKNYINIYNTLLLNNIPMEKIWVTCSNFDNNYIWNYKIK